MLPTIRRTIYCDLDGTQVSMKCYKCGGVGADASGRCFDCVNKEYKRLDVAMNDKRSLWKIRDIEKEIRGYNDKD